MKKNLVGNFSNDLFVKPLYKLKRSKNKHSPPRNVIETNVGSTVKLDGDEIHVKRYVVSGHCNFNSDLKFKTKYDSTSENSLVPGACESVLNIEKDIVDRKIAENYEQKKGLTEKHTNMIDSEENTLNNTENGRDDQSKSNVTDRAVIIHKVPDTWLKVYPAPKLKGESIPSMLFRCMASQLGLATILALWSLIWVFVIQSYEGPYEIEVSAQFQRAQNQLVIDLATELRQITPVSPKWRAAIEARIDAERRLTIQAVRRGVKLHPGHFWDLPGTFLFIIYVMTALGFGAPVPQTLNGRSLALVYAVVAVPTHFYLMVNASTCVTVHIDHCIVNLQRSLKQRSSLARRHIESPDPDCSRNSKTEVVKTGTESFRRKIWCIISPITFGRCVPLASVLYYAMGAMSFGYYICIISPITFGRCVPLASVLYYAMGAMSFGWARGKEPVEIVLFPLEFTTGGGLEHVECHIRILYGFYVEGAMWLLALALAALRRRNVAAIATMSSRYRLFESEDCEDCVQQTMADKSRK